MGVSRQRGERTKWEERTMALSRLADDWNMQGNVAREKFLGVDGQRTFMNWNVIFKLFTVL